MNNKKYFNCKDENGYMKKDREWIDKFKALYNNYTADELIAYEKEIYSMGNDIRGLEHKVHFISIILYNNYALFTAIEELIKEKTKKKGGDV